MVWTTIPTVLAQDTLTAAWLNTHLRDNQLETLGGQLSPGGPSIGVTNGQNEAVWRPIAWDYKTSTSTTSSTSPVNVGPSAGLANIEHSGDILIQVTAEIANSGSSFTNYNVGSTTGALVGTTNAVRISSTSHLSLSCHMIHWGVPSPVSLTGWLWTNNGATTASVFNSRIVVWAM